MANFPMLSGTIGDAAFVDISDQQHRLWLTRNWHDKNEQEIPFALFIGANPSTARGDVDDLTIRKEQTFSDLRGYKSMIKLNISTYCATNPDDLKNAVVLSAGSNTSGIMTVARSAGLIVLATGDLSKTILAEPAIHIFSTLRSFGYSLKSFGVTANGWPRHTSRIAYSLTLEKFNLDNLKCPLS